MLIEKADMLDALLGNFAGMDLLTDAAEGNCVVLGYVTGWLDAISTLIHVEKKKHDERKELLEQLKQSGARTNADGFCDTAEQIEEDLEEMNAREAECEVCQKFGEWIEDDYGFNRCSECGWDWDEREQATPYCPNCGAKMDGGDDDAAD